MDQLKVHNSLKPGAPVPFVPIEKGKVSWYVCGPTVYDHSHLGHARNYVSTDIIRRIMKHYFQFDVKFVMNITDVDDKVGCANIRWRGNIILKARRQKLLELEKSKTYTEAELAKLAAEAFQSYAKANLPALLEDGSELTPRNYEERRDAAYGKVLAGGALTGEGKPGDAEAKMKMHLSNLSAAAKAIQEEKVFGGADEILLPYLDSLYKDSIDAKDHSIFTRVTQYWEEQFMQDMDDLNVMKPDVITRVTTYVPQIATFVEKIIEKGFAYESEGSVYFDIGAFEKAGNPYARLRPESRNDKALQEEGEGSLSKNLGGKRGPGDFALWKKSKSGEPSWPSPWGEGRPGWHIECSVMASDVLGSKMDIHSGGIDLAFPHHDNELAQSEAYFCEHGHGPHEWVNYFLHMGHLSIAGSKMSKSLKNFQTIRDALATDYTPRGMRIVFLMGRWNDGVEISPELRLAAEGWEATVNNFFVNVKSLLVEADAESTPVDLDSLTLHSELQTALDKAQKDLHTALTESFDTPRAMLTIQELIKESNIHINTHNADVNVRGLEKVARWVTKILGIFGLDANAKAPYDGLGWISASTNSNLSPQELVAPYATVLKNVKQEIEDMSLNTETLDKLLAADVDAQFASLVSAGSKDQEKLALPYIRAIAKTRHELRKVAATSEHKKQILSLSDRIRDTDLTNLGVYLDDRPNDQESLIKFIPKEELLAQKEEKAAKEREKAAQKEEARLAREKLEQEKIEKAKVNPLEMYKDDRFSEWDAEGLPTKTKDGKDVPKSALKKLKKDWEKQKKAHEDWKAKAQSGETVLSMDIDPAAYGNNQPSFHDAYPNKYLFVSKCHERESWPPGIKVDDASVPMFSMSEEFHQDRESDASSSQSKRFTRSDLLNRHRRIHVQNDAAKEVPRSHVTPQSVSSSPSEHQSIANLVHRDSHSASPVGSIRPDVWESSLPPGMSPHRENLPSIQDLVFSGHSPASQSHGLSSLVEAALATPPTENNFQAPPVEALNPTIWDGFMLYNDNPNIYMGSYDADISWTMECLSQDSWSYMDLDLEMTDTQICKTSIPADIDRPQNDPDMDGENVGTDHWPDKISGSESPPRWIPKPFPRLNPEFWQEVLHEARFNGISIAPRIRITDEIRSSMVDMLQIDLPSDPVILEVSSFTFPPPAVLDYFLHLFFQHIHPRFPVIHIPTFNVFTTSPLLLVSMMLLGSSHSKADRNRFLRLFHNRARVSGMRLHEIEDKHLRVIDNIYSLLNLCLAGAWSGDKIMFEFAEGVRGILVSSSRRARLLDCRPISRVQLDPDTLPRHSPQEIEWLSWIETEKRKRLGLAIYPCISKAETTNCVFPCPDQYWDAPSPQAWKMLLGPTNMPPASYYLHALNGILLHKWTKPAPPIIPTTTFGKNLLLYAIHTHIFDWRTSVSMLNPTGLMGTIGNHALDIGAGLLSRRRWLIDALDSWEECYGRDVSTTGKLLRELGYVSLDVSLSDVHLMAGRSVKKQDSEFAAVNLKYWANSDIADGTMGHVYEMLRVCNACIRNDEAGIGEASYELAVALFTGGMVCWVYAQLRTGLGEREKVDLVARVSGAGDELRNMGRCRMGEMFGRILKGFGT
ncbi:hypothetical protein CJF30_00010990 [Rutstroemia sp. NJR-2017a BBW]|nr:hypothetical protein CJF30_00010990 [Rutstroemia sp. NJR-2017a BBW]